MPRRADLVTISTSTPTRRALPKLSVDEIFFKHEDSDDEPGDFSFVQHQPRHALRSQYVDRRIRHFLRVTPQSLDPQTSLLMPYPADIVIPKRPRAMLFRARDGKAIMSIRDPAQPEVELVADDEAGETVDDSWDHLSKWVEMKDDNVLPVYGDSGSEGNYDSDLLDELEDEALDRETHDAVSRYMPKEDVLELMDAYIEQRSAMWTRDKLPKLQSKAWSIWRKVRPMDRSLTVIMKRSDLEHLEKRLRTLKDHLSNEHYSNPAEVQARCAILDTTVDEQMDLKFRIRVLTSPLPPERPQSAPRKAPKQHKKTDDDEESLGSETDRDDLKNFIEKDVDDDRPLKVHSLAKPKAAYQSSHLTNTQTPPRKRSAANPARASSKNNVIDLTSSSPTANRVQSSTDDEDGYKYDASMVNMVINSTEAMLMADEFKISIWPMQMFKDYQEPLGLLMKVLLEMDINLRRSVYLRVQRSEESSILQNEVANALKAVYKGASKVPGLSTDASRTAMLLARLWLCWIHIDNRYMAMSPAPQDQYDLDPKNLTVMISRMKDMAFLKPLAIPVESQANNLSQAQSRSSNKTKRPRKSVRKDVAVASLHEAGRERLVAAAEAQQQLQSSLQNFGDMPQVAINPATGVDQGFIYINKSIASRIKPHQVEGVRFMWREVITADPSSAQGCLLAHTMGLGKTMQTITLLVTIAEAAASSDPGIVMQIPEAIRFPRILLLCPAGIIENWSEEWRAWKPRDTKNVGQVRDLVGLPPALRMDEITAWYEGGGVLIMGYEMFRNLVTRKSKDTNDEERLRLMRHYLLEGPNMVVADEAHKLKNQSTGVSLQASNFRTTGRVALTGSPMANNLQEYYSMLSWVAPGYLGTPQHFASYYQRPIEEGLYEDATNYEQRKSLKVLKALMKDIEPKVQRKDISAVKNELKPKVEFVINVGLTNLQFDAYKFFIHSIQNNATDSDSVPAKNTLDWLNILSLLCDHPAPFLAKLQERHERVGAVTADRANRARSGSGDDEEDVDVRRLPLPEGLLERENKLFELIPQKKHVRLSAKMVMIEQIVLQSRRVGDRVLIFTHWIPVLDYIEEMLRSIKNPALRVGRLDGSTKLETRQGITQDMNSGKYDVLLISTTAGGIGLNIYGANRVIVVDFRYNPANEEQAVGRAYRLGQPKPVYVYHLLTAGTFEQPLHHITIFKRQLASRVLDHKNPRRAAQKSREMLFEPKKVGKEDLDHVRGLDVVLDAVLSTEVGAHVTSITTTDSLHRDTDEKLTEDEEREVEEMRAKMKELKAMAGQAQIAYGGIQGV